MNIVDVGQGVPVILVPGIQGRWEWHRPAVDALARTCRVLTFSYDDGAVRANGDVDSYCAQIEELMRRASVTKAVVCGVSYGGLVASVFAARHPDNVAGLVLASALPPTWKPDRRVQTYLRLPRLMLPVFLVLSLRMFTEIREATHDLGAAVRTATSHAWNALTHMFSPTLMARRAARLQDANLTLEVRTVTTPALVIVGDEALDRVVPVHRTLEYQRLLSNVDVVTLAHTGHLGCVTRPDAFAELVASFATAHMPVGPTLEGEQPAETEKRRVG